MQTKITVITIITLLLTIGNVYASDSVSGEGTNTLTITSDFSDYNKIIDYFGESLGGHAPITSSPNTYPVADGGASSTSTPLRFVGTNTGCGGMGLNYTACLATGQSVGSTAGYYVTDENIWCEVGDDECSGDIPPEPPTVTGIQIATSTCTTTGGESECRYFIDGYIGILYLPIYFILFFLIILIGLNIYEFRNPWKT